MLCCILFPCYLSGMRLDAAFRRLGGVILRFAQPRLKSKRIDQERQCSLTPTTEDPLDAKSFAMNILESACAGRLIPSSIMRFHHHGVTLINVIDLAWGRFPSADMMAVIMNGNRYYWLVSVGRAPEYEELRGWQPAGSPAIQ